MTARPRTLCTLLLVVAVALARVAAADTIDEQIDKAKKNKEGLGELGSGDGGGSNTAVCVTTGGPFGCTGRFPGKYDLQCQNVGYEKAKPDFGVGSLSFLGNGSVELRLTSTSGWGNAEGLPGSETNPIVGWIKSNGHVLVEAEKNTEGGGVVTLRWEGQFSLVGAGGGTRPTGSGRYDSKGVFLDGDVVNICQGSFTLD